MIAVTRWNVGDVLVTKVVEHELTVPFDGLLVGVPPDVAGRRPWLAPHFLTGDGAARTSIHGLVIEPTASWWTPASETSARWPACHRCRATS